MACTVAMNVYACFKLSAFISIYRSVPLHLGYAVVVYLVKALSISTRTQHLTEMSIRNIPGGKGRSVRKADNGTTICEPIV
jgi:hypothetical protein